MKIAVAGMGAGGLDDTVSLVFGASRSFTLVDAEDQEFLSIEIVVNPTFCVLGTAAAESARDLAGRGVDAVIAGEFGPEAVQVFSSAGISTYRLQRMPVRDAVKQFLNLAADTVRVVRARDRADGVRDPDVWWRRRPRPPAVAGREAALAPSLDEDLLSPGSGSSLHLL